MTDTYQWFVGIDWGYETHQVCVIDHTGRICGERAVRHEVEAVDAALAWIATLTGAAPDAIAVAIERPRGTLVEMIFDRGYPVFAINPKQLDRFRDRFTVAAAKDDRRDSHVLADSLRTDPRAFTRVVADDPLVVQLRTLGRLEAELDRDRGRLSNRLREQVYRVAPALGELNPAADEPWFWTLVEQACVPAPHVTITDVRTILRSHRIRRLSAETVLAAVQHRPFPLAPGVLAAAAEAIAMLIEQLRVLTAQRRRCVHREEALLQELQERPAADGDACGHHDVEILSSLPGLGRKGIIAMLTEATPLLASRDYVRLRAQAGAAPVTIASGKRRLVAMRRACNPRLRDAVYHWARVSLQLDPAARAYYDRARGRHHGHARALRALANRWLRTLIAMLTTRTLYAPRPVPAR